ncbi:hypothetical protein F5B21DRAFT_497997 [Xylaria acuta]|nr:hypothetical protein F5B21DRAFT_497997 [Xylaria acuta]
MRIGLDLYNQGDCRLLFTRCGFSSHLIFILLNVVAEIWKQSELGNPIFIFTYGLKHMFRILNHALVSYIAGDFGSHHWPHPKSDVAPHNRLNFFTHLDLFRAFGGLNMSKPFVRCVDVRVC